MPTFIALLRAVNLGPRTQVTQPALRAAVEAAGGTHVRTWLASGNAVFEARSVSAGVLEARLEAKVAAGTGVAAPVVVRSSVEWAGVVRRNPFPGPSTDDPAHVLVYFLKRPPDPTAWARLRAAYPGPEPMVPSGQQLYVHYLEGVGRSRLTAGYLDRALGTVGTARNWSTVLKLAELAGA